MKSLMLTTALIVAAASIVPAQVAQGTRDDDRIMTDVTVIQLVQAGVAPDLILNKIKECEPHFLLTTAALIQLKQYRVPDDLVRAMAAKQNGQPVPIFPTLQPPAPSAAQSTVVAAVEPTPPVANGAVPTGAVSQGGPVKRRSPSSFGGQYETGLGTVQAVGFGGVEYMKNGVGSHPVFGSMVLVGLDRYVSAVGEYAYNATGGFGVAGLSTSVQDVSGGIDIHPSGMRVVPYGSFGIGGQRLGGSASANGYSASVSTWEGGFNFGGGVRVYITRRIGIDVDVRGLRAFNDQLGIGLFGRATGGLFFQFN